MEQNVLPIRIIKVCRKCGLEKSLDDFAKRSHNKSGKSSWCKECFRKHNRKTDKFRKRNSNAIEKARYLARRRKYFIDHPEIHKPKRKELYEKNRLKVKDQNLRKCYGISLEQYNEMSAAQGNRCAICKDLVITLHVDHCHKSGKIRGLLCNNCNRALGLMGDTLERVSNAVEYLRRFSG